MGEHKYNQTAIAAKEGKIPPRHQGKSKAQIEREMYRFLKKRLLERMVSEADSDREIPENDVEKAE